MPQTTDRWEAFSDRVGVYPTPAAPVGTDALLLADFSAPGKDERVCDLGSGCGVIPLYWNRDPALPAAGAVVDAVELEEEAAACCARSVERSGLAGRIRLHRADLRHLEGLLPAEGYDRVTGNPPYFPAGEKGARGLPSSAARRMARFEAGPDQPGCTFRDMARAAARLLKNGGCFCLCHRPERLTDVLAVLRETGLEPKRLRLVGGEPGAEPFLFLCEARKGSRPGLKMEIQTVSGEDKPE